MEAQSGTVHGVLGVVADGLIEMLPRSSSPPTVPCSSYAQQADSLRLRVHAIAGNDVTPDEEIAQSPQFEAYSRRLENNYRTAP